MYHLLSTLVSYNITPLFFLFYFVNSVLHILKPNLCELTGFFVVVLHGFMLGEEQAEAVNTGFPLFEVYLNQFPGQCNFQES